MKPTQRDVLAVGVAALLLVALVISTTREKAKQVPIDDNHRAFHEAMEKRGDRIDVERGCVICHSPQTKPLPKKHPPKEQCLLCHKLT